MLPPPLPAFTGRSAGDFSDAINPRGIRFDPNGGESYSMFKTMLIATGDRFMNFALSAERWRILARSHNADADNEVE